MSRRAAERAALSSESDAAPQAVLRTLVVTDLVDSTRLVEELGDFRAYEIASRHDRMARRLLARHGGLEIDKTDGFLFLFERPLSAVTFALAYQRELAALSVEVGAQLRSRTGIHLGEVFLRENPPEDVARGAKPLEVEGLAKPLAARVMSLAGGKQILMTEGAFNLARQAAGGEPLADAPLSWLAHGPYLFKGVAEPVEVFEVGWAGLSLLAVPQETGKARRAVAAGDEVILGWRPGPGQEIPRRAGWTLERKLGLGGFGEVWLAVQRDTGDKRAFKFCYEATRLRALQREVTLFRLLKETLGDREEIVRILDWSFDEAPYFLECEYVEGGDLVDWAAERGGIGEVPLAERLEIAAQVADALAAAHSVGVLHKDVKPQNVLVTRDRQGRPRAKLTDFGIAQVLDHQALLARGITVLGMTELDTPDSRLSGSRLYMAPEVAEGRPATVQADLYALGVMLYQMIAGDFQHALATGWRRDVADDLLAEDIACFVDGSPGQRPASAREVAERLRRLEERRAELDAERRAREEAEAQRRALETAQRRRKQLTVIAAAAVVVLAVVTVLAVQAFRDRRKAELAEQVADQRRGQAEDLIGYMVGDLREKLAPVGRLDILDGIGAKAMGYFAAVPENELSDGELLTRSKVLHQIGSIRIDQGKLAEALPPLRESLALARVLAARAPADSQRKFELGQSLFWVGDAQWLQGDLDGALGPFREYLAVSEELVARDPGNSDWQLELAYSHSNIGSVLEARGDLEGALREYRATLDIKKRLVERAPDNPDWRLDLARTYNSIAVLKRRTGHFAAALKDFRAELAIKEALDREQPSHTQRRRELALVHHFLGDILEDLGEDGLALASFERAASIVSGLVTGDPENRRWQCDLATYQLRIGRILRNRGDLGRARQQLSSCIDGMQSLVSLDPANVVWGQSLAFCRKDLGELFLETGDLVAAEREAESARKIGEAQAAKGDPESIEFVGAVDLVLGRIKERSGDPDGARQAWSRTVATLSPLAAGSRDRNRLDPLARGLIYLKRLPEAEPIVTTLFQLGYKNSSFAALCRESGLEEPHARDGQTNERM
ncbi:MAG: protein kinase domain-containing protein [Thermoanaerobaculia bacterium]